MEAYNLKAVIDLRSGAEIRKKPDLIMAGVEYYHIPILEEVSGLCDTGDIRELLQKIPADPWEYVRNFYAQIGTDFYAIKQFARLWMWFTIMKKEHFSGTATQEEGERGWLQPYFWHCWV